LESSIEKTSPSKKPEVFYGYWILVVAFLSVFIFSGCSVGVFSLFVKPLQTEFGWGRGEIMVAFSVLFLAMGAAAPFIGSLIDRYGAKGVISVGALIGGLGFASLNLMHNLWHFYVAYAVIGVAMAAIGQVPASALVSNWFKKRRGTAIGIMSTGIGAGVLALAPLFGGYILPNFGWQASYLALAILTWILIPLVLLVVRTKPADMGLYPDGIENSEGMAKAKASLTAKGFSLKMASGTAAFWLIAITFFITGFSALGVVQNQVPHLQDIGYSLATAASALTGLGLGSAIGKFIFGWLCDQIPAKYACTISCALLVIGTIILLSLKPASPSAIIWLYAIIFGLGNGGWLPTMSMLINVNFGLASYGAIFGMITLIQNLGGAIGPFFGGYMYDIMNTYYWAFIIFLASYAVAIPAVLAVHRPKSLE
jgi:MFS family permease